MFIFVVLLLVAGARGFQLPLRSFHTKRSFHTTLEGYIRSDLTCVDAVLLLQHGRPSPSLEAAGKFVEFTAVELVESLSSDVDVANRCVAQHSLYYAAIGGTSNPPSNEVMPCWFNKTESRWTTRGCCNYQDWEAGVVPSVFCVPNRCRMVVRDVFFGYYSGGWLSGAPTIFGPPPDVPPALSMSGATFQSMILDASKHVEYNGTFFKAAYNATAHKEFLAKNQMVADIVYLRGLFPTTVELDRDGRRAKISPYDEATRFLFVIDAAGEPCKKALERHPEAAALVRTLRVLRRVSFEQ